MPTKKENADAIKTAYGVDLSSSTLTAPQLDELGVIAARGADGRADFDAKLAELTPAAPAQAAAAAQTASSAQAAAASKPAAPQKTFKNPIKVRVSDAIAAFNGEFTDPDTGSSIGKDMVTVESTPFVAEKLRSREIVEER